jgi:hypothetical protein
MQEKKEMLLTYLKSNVAPVLVDFLPINDFDFAVTIPANIDIKELNGHYEGLVFIPPKWLNEILSSTKNKMLVIDKIDTISKEEQLKFVELLKYRKILTFELPKDCLIIITANEINTEKISNEIYSLVACI